MALMAPMALMASVALVAPMAPMALVALMAPMARVALMAPNFLGEICQVMFSHHSDQMTYRSQVSWVAL